MKKHFQHGLAKSMATLNEMCSRRLTKIAVGISLAFSLTPSASAQKLPPEELVLPVMNPPALGTYYMLKDKQGPPYPFDPSFGQLPVYEWKPGVFLVDDSQVDYVSLKNSLGGGGMSLMSVSGPGGFAVGGGLNGGGEANGPSYLGGWTTNAGLKFGPAPIVQGGIFSTWLQDADTNSAYEIYEKLQLSTNGTWQRIAAGQLGQTNFEWWLTASATAFYRAADSIDSDWDGLSDAFEALISHTSPLDEDSDHDGILDGDEDSNLNGIPDLAEYHGLTRAVIYTVDSTAAEGGGGGEFNIRLPFPAPTNGTTIVLHLGGTAGYESDYLLSTQFGYITSEVSFLAGETTKRIFVTAVDDGVQQTRPRTVQLSLASATNYVLDSTPANVSLIDNDLPVVAIFAEDAVAAESTANATNKGLFLIRRYGDVEQQLLVWFDVSGSAQNDVDYTGITPWTYIPAGSDRTTVEITPSFDAAYEGDEDVILTLANPFAAYSIHNVRSAARVVIKDDELPAVTIIVVVDSATEGIDSAVIRVNRSGSLAQPLTVNLALAGSATNGVDFPAIPESVTFPPGVGETNLIIQPLADGVEEMIETFTVTLRGGAGFNIVGTNAATVLLEDNSPTRYTITSVKSASVYSTSPAIDSPAIFEIRRFGHTFAGGSLPYAVYTNTTTGLQEAAGYRVSGDVSGGYIMFPLRSSVARVYFTGGGAAGFNNPGAIHFHVPSVSTNLWPIQLLRKWEYVRLEVLSSVAIEGTTTNGRLRLWRLFASDPVSATFTYSGNAMGPGDPLVIDHNDHNLVSPFTLTIPLNVLAVETNIIASADGYLEGWETMVVRPVLSSTNVSIDPVTPQIVQLREDVADPNTLPGFDSDGDGLPDFWEIAHNLDPLNGDDGHRDGDVDRLINFDEYQAGTNPRLADTNGDGISDLQQTLLQLEHPENYVPISLYVHDKGKVNNGMNCAVCHTTQLKVGDNTLFNPRSSSRQPIEKTFWYEKGHSYPISLQELVAVLPPTTNTIGNPTTTETYTAGLGPGVNGPQAFLVLDPNNKLGTNKPWADFPTNNAASIGTLVVPRIEVTWETFLLGNSPLDHNPNAGGGLRVFPDQLSPTDTESRKGVIVKIQTTPPVPGQRVILRSLDVDDPTPFPDDEDGVIDTNDFGILVQGNDNRGSPNVGTLYETNLTLDVFGQASTIFDVTMQPGDNFRVAAVLDLPGASNHLNALQVNSTLDMYVGSGQEPAEGFIGGLSPMLTVWRKLHLEFDSMTNPPASGPEANFISGSITRVRRNYPVVGRSRISILHSDFPFSPVNQFENGKIDIATIGAFRTIRSISGWGASVMTDVEIDSVPTNNLVGLTVKLYDDDDQYLVNDLLYPSSLNLQSPPLPADSRSGEFIGAITSAYAQAYVRPVDAKDLGLNNQRTIPFKRIAGVGYLTSPFDVGNLELKGKDRPEFWAYSIVVGYEAARNEDGEPDREEVLLGINVDDLVGSPLHGFCVVYIEGNRDKEWGINRVDGSVNQAGFTNHFALTYQQFYLNRLYGTMAHELGHAPGGSVLDHFEKGLMQTGGDPISGKGFSAATIIRFRTALKWTP